MTKKKKKHQRRAERQSAEDSDASSSAPPPPKKATKALQQQGNHHQKSFAEVTSPRKFRSSPKSPNTRGQDGREVDFQRWPSNSAQEELEQHPPISSPSQRFGPQSMDIQERQPPRKPAKLVLNLFIPSTLGNDEVLQALYETFEQDLEDILLGIQKDTRVQSVSKIFIVLKEQSYFDHLLKLGILIHGKRYFPRTPQPRPPPSIRGYIPNFPVWEDINTLGDSLTAQGISVFRINPRTLTNSTVRIGGWQIWTRKDSGVTPPSFTFQDEEFAIIWRERRPTATTSIRHDTLPQEINSTKPNTEPPAIRQQQDTDPPTTTTARQQENTAAPPKPETTVRHDTVPHPNTPIVEPKETKKTTRNRPPKKVDVTRQKEEINLNADETSIFTTRNIEKIQVRENEVLFYNFPVDTSVKQIKSFCSTRNITSANLQVFRDRSQLGFSVEYDSPMNAVSQAQLCEYRKHRFVDDDGEKYDIFARCYYGEGDNRRTFEIFNKVHQNPGQ